MTACRFIHLATPPAQLAPIMNHLSDAQPARRVTAPRR